MGRRGWARPSQAADPRSGEMLFLTFSLRDKCGERGLEERGKEREAKGFDSEPAWGGGAHITPVRGTGGHEMMRSRGLAWLRDHQLESEVNLPVYVPVHWDGHATRDGMDRH